jgi:hypothetical protein
MAEFMVSLFILQHGELKTSSMRKRRDSQNGCVPNDGQKASMKHPAKATVLQKEVRNTGTTGWVFVRV